MCLLLSFGFRLWVFRYAAPLIDSARAQARKGLCRLIRVFMSEAEAHIDAVIKSAIAGRP